MLDPSLTTTVDMPGRVRGGLAPRSSRQAPVAVLLGQLERLRLRLGLSLEDGLDGGLVTVDLGPRDLHQPALGGAQQLQLLLTSGLGLVARGAGGLLDEVLAQQVVAEFGRVPGVGRLDEVADRLLGLLLVVAAPACGESE